MIAVFISTYDTTYAISKRTKYLTRAKINRKVASLHKQLDLKNLDTYLRFCILEAVTQKRSDVAGD